MIHKVCEKIVQICRELNEYTEIQVKIHEDIINNNDHAINTMMIHEVCEKLVQICRELDEYTAKLVFHRHDTLYCNKLILFCNYLVDICQYTSGNRFNHQPIHATCKLAVSGKRETQQCGKCKYHCRIVRFGL